MFRPCSFKNAMHGKITHTQFAGRIPTRSPIKATAFLRTRQRIVERIKMTAFMANWLCHRKRSPNRSVVASSSRGRVTSSLNLGQYCPQWTVPHCCRRNHSLGSQRIAEKLLWESCCIPQLLTIGACLPSTDRSRELRCVQGSKARRCQSHVADQTGPRPLDPWQFHLKYAAALP